jgi:hypothetical protein
MQDDLAHLLYRVVISKGNRMTEEQALYKELFTLLSRRQEAESQHSQVLSALAFKFREAVYQQLGFPEETFIKQPVETEASSNAEAQREPWVRLYEYADGQILPATGPLLRTIREDGSLHFAIGVSLSAELDSYPKYHFWSAYSLTISNQTHIPVLETLSGKPREYRINNTDFSVAVDDFVSDIKTALDPSSIFSAAKKSDCMGFFCSA